MTGAAGAVTDVVGAIPGRFSFGAAAAGAAAGANDAGTLEAAATFGFAIPGFFFGRLARISSRSFINAWPSSFCPLQLRRMVDFGSLIEIPIPRIVSFGR